MVNEILSVVFAGSNPAPILGIANCGFPEAGNESIFSKKSKIFKTNYINIWSFFLYLYTTSIVP